MLKADPEERYNVATKPSYQVTVIKKIISYNFYEGEMCILGRVWAAAISFGGLASKNKWPLALLSTRRAAR